MNETPLKQIIDTALSKIGNVADSNTVIGEPITTASGVTIIPFSKVSVGFTSGGSDFDGKNAKPESTPHFAGGNGAGVTVTPLGFIVVSPEGEVRMLDLKHPTADAPTDPVNKAIDAINGLVDKTPDLVSKIRDAIGKKKSPDEEGTEAAAAEETAEEKK